MTVDRTQKSALISELDALTENAKASVHDKGKVFTASLLGQESASGTRPITDDIIVCGDIVGSNDRWDGSYEVKVYPSYDAPTSPPVTPISYIVKKGDTFAKIAKEHKLSIGALADLNPKIENINEIKVGDVIKTKKAKE